MRDQISSVNDFKIFKINPEVDKMGAIDSKLEQLSWSERVAGNHKAGGPSPPSSEFFMFLLLLL